MAAGLEDDHPQPGQDAGQGIDQSHARTQQQTGDDSGGDVENGADTGHATREKQKHCTNNPHRRHQKRTSQSYTAALHLPARNCQRQEER